MIKVHNIIPLNQILNKQDSKIYSIGSKNNNSHIPHLICGEIFKKDIIKDELKKIFPIEKEQTTFTYIQKGNLELSNSKKEKLFLQEGDLYLSKSITEKVTFEYNFNIIGDSIEIIQMRFPLNYNIQMKKDIEIIHERNMSVYKDPSKEFIRLYSHISGEDTGSFFLWFISIVPGGKMHIPIPIQGRSFALIINGKAHFEDSIKTIESKNIISLESQKKGNDLNISNASGASKLNLILLGGN